MLYDILFKLWSDPLIQVLKKIAIGFVFLALAAWGINTLLRPRSPASAGTDPVVKGFVKEGEIAFVDSLGRILIAIDVEIASRPEERNQGLMYRDHMPPQFGMLFIFEQMAPRSFWMRNTPLPLDVIFVDDQNKVVSIQTNTRPYSDDPIPSGSPAMYVIEVNAGFCAQHGIQAGMVARF